MCSCKDTICPTEPLCDRIWKKAAQDMACKAFISCRVNKGTPGGCGKFTGKLLIFLLTFYIQFFYV